jgi:hypothetical protein
MGVVDFSTAASVSMLDIPLSRRSKKKPLYDFHHEISRDATSIRSSQALGFSLTISCYGNLKLLCFAKGPRTIALQNPLCANEQLFWATLQIIATCFATSKNGAQTQKGFEAVQTTNGKW